MLCRVACRADRAFVFATLRFPPAVRTDSSAEPDVRNHVIGRSSCTLNAFRLFAYEAPETLEVRRSDLGARDSRAGDLIHRLTCSSTRTDKLIAATKAFFP
jgi:hypothetical protein